MDKEIWKDIKGYEGLYQVSNQDRIKSVERFAIIKNGKRPMKERILKECIISTGYKMSYLCKEGKVGRKSNHRLIANAFIPNPENKPCINHINGIKSDNRIENLEWCTFSENSQHAFDTGLSVRSEYQAQKVREAVLGNNYRGKKVMNTDTGEIFDSITYACNAIGADRGQAYNFLKGNAYKHNLPLRYI